MDLTVFRVNFKTSVVSAKLMGRIGEELPHIAASGKRCMGISGIMIAPGRPINNRPQVANLPTKSSRRKDRNG